MNRDDVKALFRTIDKIKPNYFSRFSRGQADRLIDSWIQYHHDSDYSCIQNDVVQYIRKYNRVPYPQQIKEKPKCNVPDWYNNTCQKQADDEMMKKVLLQQRLLKEGKIKINIGGLRNE